MSEAALHLVPETEVPHELVISSKHFSERWRWVQSSSRYTWWDALVGRPLRIPTDELVHLHGWRRFVCLELKGPPGEEIWVRRHTWRDSAELPEPPAWGDFAHFTRRLWRDLVLLALSPATFAFALFYVVMVLNPTAPLSLRCPESLQEPLELYLQMIGSLIAIPALCLAYSQWITRRRFVPFETRRIYSFTAAVLALVGAAGVLWLSSDGESRATVAKIKAECFRTGPH